MRGVLHISVGTDAGFGSKNIRTGVAESIGFHMGCILRCDKKWSAQL